VRKFGLLAAVVGVLAMLLYFFPRRREQPPPVESPNTVQRASGLMVEDLKVGEGETALPGMKVSMHYTAWLETGQRFDSSYDRKRPLDFILGAGQVMKGWDMGSIGMKPGGKRKLKIPAELAYGEKGLKDKVPPNAALLMEVEMVGVSKP
jgi:FKBP-type peptidyl-prolyl cis-trans isomerase